MSKSLLFVTTYLILLQIIMKTKKQFKDFDHCYHQFYHVNIENTMFEIWHMIDTPYGDIEKIAQKFIDHEKKCNREPGSMYRFDFRTY